MFYDKYIALCEEKGISPSKAAVEIGLNKASVTNWKKNGYTPRADVLQRIAEYFGVSVGCLVNDDETSKDISFQTDNPPVHIEGAYLRLAQGAQELGLDEEDIDFILALYKEHRRRNQ